MALGVARSRSACSSKKLGVSSFLDFQAAWYALFKALNGLEQLGRVARSSWAPPTWSGLEFCEAVRSCLEARFDGSENFYIKNNRELLGSILAAAQKLAVSKRFSALENLVFFIF